MAVTTPQSPLSTQLAKWIGDQIQAWIGRRQFLATVVAVSGNSVQVVRGGQTAPDNTYYRCLAGIVSLQSLGPGDQVCLIVFGAAPVCIGRPDA